MNTTPIQAASSAAAPSRLRALLVFDPFLLLAGLGLVGCSLVTLHGAEGSSLTERQGVFAAFGVVLALALALFDYSRLREYRYGFYVLLILANLVVFAFPASSQNGAARHIPLPFIEPQPSEFGKLLLIVTLAAVATERSRRLSERRMTARILLLALLPAMIVIAQPDLGTGLVYVAVAAAVLLFSGASWKQLTALAALAVTAVVLALAVAPSLGVNVLRGYQKERLTTFLNPPRVCGPKDTTCYQLTQSIIAIGSGEKTGRGVKGATETRYKYVPEAQDDFIFAVVGETYGFVGAAIVLSLYALLIWRTLRILTMAKNLFGTLIAGGILAMFMFQIFVNVGMTIGIMPVTGVPLPLLSYGGSSVIVSFLALGLLESIYIQARMSAASKTRVLIA